MELVIGLLIPFLGTTLGAGMVFFMKKEINQKVEKVLLGFASGVMIAASIWSLLMPSINMAEEQGKVAWIPATVGLLIGILSLLACDKIMPKLNFKMSKQGTVGEKIKKTTMLVLAVTIHNIPEGMAVGVTFAGALLGNAGITMAGAIALAIGIGIQNFPEGAIISMPLRAEGMSRRKAFAGGVVSGIVEPIGAVLTIIASQLIIAALPYLLSFAAGAMLYVVVEELMPELSQGKHSNLGTVFFAIGFSLMMVLDVALG